jgi:hypothetical protein
LAIGFEQEWKQKFACSQEDLEAYCHEKIHQIFDQESFKTDVALMASNGTIFLSNNCSSTEWARTFKFESEVSKMIPTVRD